MGLKVVFLPATGGTSSTYTIPADYSSLVSVSVIGAGGASATATTGSHSGGGGGGYASSTAVTGLVASGTAWYQTGSGAAGTTATQKQSWFNAASNAVPTLSSQGAAAAGGSNGASGTNSTGGAGGAGTVGTTLFTGGTGGNSGNATSGQGGGGGAAGPGGNGGAGGSGANGTGGGGGGGGATLTAAGTAGTTATTVSGGAGGASGANAGGAGATSTTAAGAGSNGSGGGGGATTTNTNGAAGGAGSIWTATAGGTAGPGGGGGGSSNNSAGVAGAGAAYGGGAGGSPPGNISGGAGGVVFQYAANETRYWVGGSGTWDASSTTNWSTTSGGSGGASAPTQYDSVIFDVNSNVGTGAFTVTTTTGAVCNDLTVSGLDGAMTLGLAAGNTLIVYGSYSVPASNFSTSGLGTIQFSSALAETITTNGVSHTTGFTLNGAGTFTIVGNLTTTLAFGLTQGALDLGTNNVSITALRFDSTGSVARSIAFGTTGAINTTSTGIAISMGNVTSFTYTGTSQVNLTAGGQYDFGSSAGASFTNVLNINVTGGTTLIAITASHFRSLNFTGFTGTWSPGTSTYTFYGNLTLVAGMTFTTGSGAWTFANTSGTAIITSAGKTLSSITQNTPGGTVQFATSTTVSIYTLTAGTLDIGTNTVTLTCNAFSSANSNTRVIVFGTGNIAVVAAGGTQLNLIGTSFTYTGTPTINISNNSATALSISTTNFTETNALNINVTIGTYALSIFTNSVLKNLNFTGFTGSWSSTSTYTFYGNLTFPTGITYTLTGSTFNFSATSGTQTITSSGILLGTVVQNTPGATVKFTTSTTNATIVSYTLTAGTLDISSQPSTLIRFNTFSSSNSNVRSIIFGSTYISIVNGSTWNMSNATNFTYTATGSKQVDGNTTGSAYTIVSHVTGATETNVLAFNFTITGATYTITTASSFKSLTLGTGTWNPALNSSYTFYGSLNISSITTYTTNSETFTFANTSGTATLTAGTNTIGNVTQDGVGGTLTLGSALSCNNININNGTFTTSNNNINCNYLQASSSPATRSVSFGSSTITASLSGASAINVSIPSGGGGTISAGTSSFVLTGTAPIFNSSYNTWYNLSFTNTTAGTFGRVGTVAGTSFNNISRVAPATSGYSEIRFDANTTITGTLSATGTTALNRVGIRTISQGTAVTITAAAISLSYINFQDITAAGAVIPWSGTSFANLGNNTNITFSPKTVYWSLVAGGNWSDTAWATSSGGAPASANLPLPQDTVVIDNTGLTTGNTITLDTTYMSLWQNSWMPTINCTRTNAWTHASGTITPVFSGSNITLTSVTTMTGTGIWQVEGTVSLNIACTFVPPFTVGDGTTATTATLASAFTGSSTFTLTNGTFNANNFNVSVANFSSSNSNTRTLTMGSGSWTLSGTGTVWDLTTTTGLTFNVNTANITLSDVSTTARTFNGGGLTYNNLTIGGTTGTSTFTMTGANTFNTLASTKTVAHTMVFPNVTTTVANWTISGSAGNVVTLQRTGASGTWTITKTGGGTITGIDYLSISNSTATPTLTWYAGNNSIDGGGNTGWIFPSAPSSSSNYFLLF